MPQLLPRDCRVVQLFLLLFGRLNLTSKHLVGDPELVCKCLDLKILGPKDSSCLISLCFEFLDDSYMLSEDAVELPVFQDPFNVLFLEINHSNLVSSQVNIEIIVLSLEFLDSFLQMFNLSNKHSSTCG